MEDTFLFKRRYFYLSIWNVILLGFFKDQTFIEQNLLGTCYLEHF